MITAYDSAELFFNPPVEVAILPLICFTPHESKISNGINELLITEICKRVADQLPNHTFLLPPWPYGTNSDTTERVDTFVLRYETLFLVVQDIVKSLFAHGIKKIVVINCLGSVNDSSALPEENSIVKTAVRQLNYENPELKTIWVQPFRVSSERLKRLFGNEITNDLIVKSILDYLYDHRSASELEDERAVWKEYARIKGTNLKQEKESGLGEKTIVEITQDLVDYISMTFCSISMIEK